MDPNKIDSELGKHVGTSVCLWHALPSFLGVIMRV